MKGFAHFDKFMAMVATTMKPPAPSVRLSYLLWIKWDCHLCKLTLARNQNDDRQSLDPLSTDGVRSFV